VVGAIEPQHDIAAAAADALSALRAAGCVIALSPYASAKDYADIVLPIGTFAETSGTYVNVEGRWQSVPGAAKPIGESRPAWKVLRVLANLLNLPNFDYVSSEQVRDELKMQLGEVKLDNSYGNTAALARNSTQVTGNRDVPIYQVDAIVRRATALQLTRDALDSAAGSQA